jgi:cbb3-type cytochrome oxidase subunit 3
LKSNYFSYLTMKSERNIYITAMLIYVSLALNAYVWILQYMYEKRAKHEADQAANKREQPAKEPAKETVAGVA